LRVSTVHLNWDLEQDLDNFSRVLDMDLDLNLDLMEFPGRLIGLPFVNRLFGTWEDFRAFVCFPFSPTLCNWFVHFVSNALGQRGSVGTGFGRMAFVAYGG